MWMGFSFRLKHFRAKSRLAERHGAMFKSLTNRRKGDAIPNLFKQIKKEKRGINPLDSPALS
jgi:hypothetical protein